MNDLNNNENSSVMPNQTVNQDLANAFGGTINPQPVEVSVVPAAESSMPVIEPTMPVVEPTMSTAEPTMPTVEPAMPAAEPTMPTAEPAMPTAEPAMSAVEPTMSAVEPTMPANTNVEQQSATTKNVSIASNNTTEKKSKSKILPIIIAVIVIVLGVASYFGIGVWKKAKFLSDAEEYVNAAKALWNSNSIVCQNQYAETTSTDINENVTSSDEASNNASLDATSINETNTNVNEALTSTDNTSINASEGVTSTDEMSTDIDTTEDDGTIDNASIPFVAPSELAAINSFGGVASYYLFIDADNSEEVKLDVKTTRKMYGWIRFTTDGKVYAALSDGTNYIVDSGDEYPLEFKNVTIDNVVTNGNGNNYQYKNNMILGSQTDGGWGIGDYAIMNDGDDDNNGIYMTNGIKTSGWTPYCKK